jgi:hypothetical protein
MKTKICTKCKIEKNVCEFGYHPQTKDKLQCRCKECRKIDKQKYYFDNKDKVSEKSKDYRKKNIDKLLEYSKKYREENKIILSNKKKEKYQKSPEIYYHRNKLYIEKNKEKVRNFKNEYQKKKKKESVLYRLKVLMRDRLNKFIKYSKMNKNNSTFDIIGCNPQQLKEHIENQFIDGMSWDNHGLLGWHIDHIIPLSSAKTEEDLIKLCHYTNLQPLWAKDNLLKSNKIIL